MIHGELDDVVPSGDAKAFVRRATELGWWAEYIGLPSQGHRTTIDAETSTRILAEIE